VHFAFTVALALAIFAYGRRLDAPWVGAAAAFLTFASPVVGIDGTSAYVDVAVAAIVFAVFYFLEIWDEGRNPGVLIAVGLLGGYAYAAKYTAFVILPFALAFVLWRARKLRPAIIVFLVSIVMFAPWMIKDYHP
jgi:4-amino-4-deoxy-L-arabinose transferase-like glycosyltransferase